MSDAANGTPTGEQGVVISYTRAFADVSFLTFLEAMPIAPRIYWESGQVEIEFAGGGAAVELYGTGAARFDQVQAQVERLFANIVIDSTAPESVQPRLFGGFAFREEAAASTTAGDVWVAFPSAYLVLPRYQITRTHSQSGFQTWLTINRQLMPLEHADSALDSLEWEFESAARRVMMYARDGGAERKTAYIESLDYPFNSAAWDAIITDATARMRAHEFEKVVLARTADLRLSAPANLLAALERMGAKYPHTYRFLIEPGAGRAFFGASPELLAHVRAGVLHTAALAGSRRRGLTEADDQVQADALMHSAKDRAEHQVVVDFLRERLQPFVTELEAADTPQILRLSNIQHLYTPVRAALQPGVNALALVRALHPTPALGGYPQAVSMEKVAQYEPVSRGWYAAPIGWIDARGEAMFAVAIRAAVSSGKRVRMYAGAGIVADSDPAKEWEEIELKFRPMMEALGVDMHERAES
ncbi:MAG: isochorismate synthase [bacterium]|nr:isochorismate synthase [bacterium]